MCLYGALRCWVPIVVVQLLSHVQLFATPWIVALKLLCPPLTLGVCSNSRPSSQWCCLTISSSVAPLLLPSVFPSMSFSLQHQWVLMSWLLPSGDQSIGASASVLPMNIQDFQWIFNEYAVQGTLKSLLQHHSSKPAILQCSAFFMVQLSHPHVTTGKTIAVTI